MAWTKAGSTTSGSAGDTITISSMTASNFNVSLLRNNMAKFIFIIYLILIKQSLGEEVLFENFVENWFEDFFGNIC